MKEKGARRDSGVRVRIFVAPLLAFVCLLAASCGGPRIVPDDELAQIFHDVYLTNAYIDENPVSGLDSLSLYEPLFKRYGYTSEDIQYTIGSFAKRKSSRLSEQVVERAIALLRDENFAVVHRIAVRDTIAQVARRRFARVVWTDSLIGVRRIADTARLRVVLPASEGSYEVRFTYLIDSTDLNPTMRTSIYFVNKRGRPSPPTQRRLQPMLRETVVQSVNATAVDDSLVVDLNGYPEKNMKTPSMTIENLTVTHYLPEAVAIDSMSRGWIVPADAQSYETYFRSPGVDSIGTSAR